MHEFRIKLPPELHQKWSSAAQLRGLSVTSFIIATVSNALLASGELHQNSTSSGVAEPVTPTPIAAKPAKPVDPLDPVRIAERFRDHHGVDDKDMEEMMSVWDGDED